MSNWDITKDMSCLSGEVPDKRRWCIVHTKVGTKGDNPLIVIGINPSGGTHTDNGKPKFSPTAGRLHRIAEESVNHARLGSFNRLILFNITPVATSSIKELKKLNPEVIRAAHSENLNVISNALKEYNLKGAPVLLCFGNAVRYIAKKQLLNFLLPEILDCFESGSNIYCLGGLTKEGYPWHPRFCKNTIFSKVKFNSEKDEFEVLAE